jgi:hypothetical protein
MQEQLNWALERVRECLVGHKPVEC